jgi:hypothetical protein
MFKKLILKSRNRQLLTLAYPLLAISCVQQVSASAFTGLLVDKSTARKPPKSDSLGR